MSNDLSTFTETTVAKRVFLRSEMVQEIISRKPDFIERWALLICLGIFLFLLAGTWFVKYPDLIEAHATLTASDAPKEIVIRQEGRLVKLSIHNNERVYKGQVFGWIESTADHAEVLELSRQLDSTGLLNARKAGKVSPLYVRRFENLGEIQPGYQTFIAALQVFNDYMVNGFYHRKKAMLENDIHNIEDTYRTIQRRKELTEQDIQVADESYKMNKQLLDQKIISAEEFRNQTSKMLNKQLAVPQLDASLLSNESQKRDKLKELEQLDHDSAQQQLTFQQALQSLKSSVDDWKRKYILQSPVNGQVFFTISLQENQYLNPGKIIGFINPDDSHFYVEANLVQSNFGKIDTGLQVQLRFDAYPYQEVGVLEGTLEYVSKVPSDSGFLANIRLNNGLITNSNKPISYKSGLKAQAFIITKNIRLLERLLFAHNKTASVGTK